MPRNQLPTLHEHIDRWDACHRCQGYMGLCKNRVYYRGSLFADIMIIGEAPGDVEAALCEPFVGPAGQYLNRLIKTVCGPQSKYYSLTFCFTNAVICPPQDTAAAKIRTPTNKEIENCSQRLSEFIDMVGPLSIICAGKSAEKAVKHVQEYQNLVNVFSMPHPSAIMRQAERGNQDRKRALEALRDAALVAYESDL